MPRHPKPVALRPRPGLAVVPQADPEAQFAIPEPPPGLLARSRVKWDQFWSSPLVRVIVPDLDLDTIETLFRLRDERDRAFRVGNRQRLVDGSAGQSVINPLLTYGLAVQKEIRAIEMTLGANPKGRLVLGVLLGDAARNIDDQNRELDNDADLDSLLDSDVLDGRSRRVSSAAVRES
jgi:hypothetical protein